MSPPPGRCQEQHRWEGERCARSRHPCRASAPHSPPIASARGPRLRRRRHLCAPGRVPQGAQPRGSCHHRSRPGAPSAPPPQLPPPPSGLLRDPEPGRLGWRQVALLPPAPRGPSAAPPAPPSPARPSPAQPSEVRLPSPPPSTPPARPAVFWRVPSLSSACASLSAASLSASVSSSSLHLWVGP